MIIKKIGLQNDLFDFFTANDIKPSIALLGWAFKKNTNDSRESAAIYVAAYLLEKGIRVQIYDPMVNQNKLIQI